MEKITEENQQNLAYQTLMEIYIEEPTEVQFNLLSSLFEGWCKAGRSNLLHHMFEIVESHESQKIRELVLEHMEKTYPDDKKNDIIELWITHPIPIMHEFIKNVLNRLELELPLKSAVYVMLDEIDSLHTIDPDFHNLDIFIKDVDPMLGSLLIQRVEKIKNPESNGRLTEILEDNENISLIERIRKRDFNYLWENILDYPLPFIAELLELFTEEGWSPVDRSGKEIFEILTELIGTSGWYSIEHIKWVVLTKKIGSKYDSLTRVDIDRREFQLQLSQDLILRPDRIKAKKFVSRGRFNLTDSELGVHIYMETVRRSDFDGLLHIPIYSNNGVELAEFAIPTSSEKNFAMDEDGMYFSVKNKQGIFSIDMDAIAALLLPISSHSETVNEMIPFLLERAIEYQKLPLQGLNLLSTLHRGREFSLWDLKEIKHWNHEDEISKNQSCNCTFGVDVGNSTTKVVLVVKDNCKHSTMSWEFRTIIHYKSLTEKIVGNEVFEKKLEYNSQTFRDIKAALRFGNRIILRIQSGIITAYDAYIDYLATILERIEEEAPIPISRIALTFPLHAPSGFESWLRNVVYDLGIDEVELIDEISASVLGSYRLNNLRGNVIFVDIGSSQMSALIAKLQHPKSRKRVEEARMREEFEGSPEIISKISSYGGSNEINKILYDVIKPEQPFEDLIYDLDKSKIQLSEKFETKFKVESSEFDLTLNPNATEEIDVSEAFNLSDLFNRFKILFRNILIKSRERGISKEKIDSIVITGKGGQWPGFLEYIRSIFKNKEVFLESDPFITAKGVGLLHNGQNIDIHLDQDYMLRVSNNGIVAYSDILFRGEKVTGFSKAFEIRPNSSMSKMVVDCWVRRPEIVFDEDHLPIKDQEQIGHRKEVRTNFSYERIFREIIEIRKESKLLVNVTRKGTLYFEVATENLSELQSTNSTVL